MSQAEVAVSMDKDLLRNIPMFAKLTDAERAELASVLRPRPVPAHQPIIWIGETGDEMFIVQLGRVRLSYPNEAGEDITLAIVGPGAFFGELSLLDGGPRTATARAEGDVTLLVLDRKGFYRFLERTPSAGIHIIATLGQRQREALEKIRGIRNVNQAAEEEDANPLQGLVDRAAGIGASGRFLLGTLVFVAIWIMVQTLLTIRNKPELVAASGFPLDSPPYFFWLGFMITLASFLLTIFVLNSQKRQADRDRIRADVEYQVNLKAQLEIMQLHQKVDRLAGMVGAGRPDSAGGQAADGRNS